MNNNNAIKTKISKKIYINKNIFYTKYRFDQSIKTDKEHSLVLLYKTKLKPDMNETKLKILHTLWQLCE